MRFILSLIILSISFMGYSLKLVDSYKIKAPFLPFIIFCSYILIIYISARLSLMFGAIIICNIIGILLFLKYVKRKDLIKELFPVYGLFFLIALVLAFILSPKILTMYDDFSHWGIISRLLVNKDALNTSLDTRVYYKSYPQATAYFIYGIVRFMGFSEGNMLFANSLFTLSGVFCIVSAFKNHIINYLLILLTIFFAFTYNIGPDALLVDTILATSAFGIFTFIYYNDLRNNLKFFLIPIFVSLVYIKNSGLFLAVFLLIFLTIKYIKKDPTVPTIAALSIIVANRSWSNHIKNEFVSTGKHTMDLNQYSKGLEGNKEYIDEFTNNFIDKVMNDYFMWALIIMIVLILIISKWDKLFVKLLLASILVYSIYQIGNYFMFITSMSAGELKRMASFGRYTRTIHIFISLVSLYIINLNYDNLVAKILSLIFLGFALIFIEPSEGYTIDDLDYRYKLHDIKIKENIENNKKILLKYNDKDIGGIHKRSAMYEFDTNDLTYTHPEDNKEYNFEEYDYVLDISK